MKTETKIIIFLLFLSPVLGEVLSGSTPPLEFINPVVLIVLVLLYGCGTLLIREAKVRWNLQWSVIFLASAYGILEEGTMVQSFFNTAHADLGVLSGYGMYFGVQWPWTIMLILFHGTMSTLIPITIAELLWPKYKAKPLLRKKGVIFSLAGLFIVATLWMIFVIGQKGDPAYASYSPNSLLIVGSILVIFLSVWLAYKYKDGRISTRKFSAFSPLIFGVAGFLFQTTNVLLPSTMAEAGISGIVTVLTQVILTTAALLFIAHQIYNRNTTTRHIVSLIFGSILFWIALTPINEFSNGISGVFPVGIIGLILLIVWRHAVLKKTSPI